MSKTSLEGPALVFSVKNVRGVSWYLPASQEVILNLQRMFFAFQSNILPLNGNIGPVVEHILHEEKGGDISFVTKSWTSMIISRCLNGT